MKKNLIIIEIASALFPQKLSFLPDKDKSRLSYFQLENQLSHSNADPIAIKFLNEIKNKFNFELVLLDSWIDQDYHNKDLFQQLFTHNGIAPKIYENWSVFHKLSASNTTLKSASHWIKENNVDNHTLILSKNHKYIMDLDHSEDMSSLSYNHTVFVDPENGISFENFKEIQKSLELWS